MIFILENETGDVTADHAVIKWIIQGYYEHLYTHKFDSLDEINQFLQKHNLN